MKKFYVVLGLFMSLLVVAAAVFVLRQDSTDGVLLVGTNSGYPPYEVLDAHGELVGFDIDLARHIGKKLNRRVVFNDMAFDALIVSLQQKKVDLVLAGLDITPKNKQEVDFVPYTPAEEIAKLSLLFWQKVPGDVTSFEDLPRLFDQAIICVQSGTSYVPLLEQIPGISPKVLTSMSDLIMDVKYKKSHACVFESAVAHAIAQEHPEFVVVDVNLPVGFVYEGTGIAIAKDRTDLYRDVDGAMQELHADGTIKALRERWFARSGGASKTTGFGFFISVLTQLARGAGVTILAAILAILLGIIGGMLFAIVGARKVFAPQIIKWLIAGYVFVVRGTPMYVQILIFYFVVPELLHVPFSPFMAGVLAVGCNSIAYVSEILRGTMNALPDGQWEAAHVLGYSRFQTLRYIVLPQVFRMALPSLANEGITITKDTSLLAAIGVLEVTRIAQNMNANLLKPIPIFLGVAIVYLLITSIISMVVSYLEKRVAQ